MKLKTDEQKINYCMNKCSYRKIENGKNNCSSDMCYAHYLINCKSRLLKKSKKIIENKPELAI